MLAHNPPPELIAEYERIAPGWGLRILEMGEREQLHRHECDRELLKRNQRELDLDRDWLSYAKQGLNFGFISFVLIGAVGLYALTVHEAVVAGVCFGTTAIGVIASFVKGRGGRPNPEKDKSDKQEG